MFVIFASSLYCLACSTLTHLEGMQQRYCFYSYNQTSRRCEEAWQEMNIPVVYYYAPMYFLFSLKERGEKLGDAVHAGGNGLWGVAGAAAVA